nr:caspid protein [Covert mortality nodavirus]UYB01120.1 caspid protein [Covert mortality nodavirus]
MRKRPRRTRSDIGRQMYPATTSAPHGVGTRLTVSGPRRTLNSNGDLTLSGRDFLGVLTVKKTSDTINPAATSVLASWDVSPQAFKQTRLEYLSRIYEMYKFTKLNFEYEPAVPTTLGCQLIAYGDTDPKDDPRQAPSKEELVRIAASHAGARQFNFIQRQTIPMATRGINKFYFTGANADENPRFTTQGKFHIIQVSDPIDLNGAPIAEMQAGAVYINWTCTFKVPQIEVKPSTLRSTTGYGLYTIEGVRDMTFVNTTNAPCFVLGAGYFNGAPVQNTPVVFGSTAIEFEGPAAGEGRVTLNIDNRGITELAPGESLRIFYTTLSSEVSRFNVQYVAVAPVRYIKLSEESKIALRDLVISHNKHNAECEPSTRTPSSMSAVNPGPYGKPVTTGINHMGVSGNHATTPNLYPNSEGDLSDISLDMHNLSLVDTESPEL